MKVLVNNYSKEDAKQLEKYPRNIVCEKCFSELEYDKSDITIGVLGAGHVKCCLCGFNNMLDDDEEGIILTKDNVEYPTHFLQISKETGAKDVCNNEFIKECIQEAIDNFRKNKDEFVYYIGKGNTMVYVFRYNGDEEYNVVVTNNYYETDIPFESEDY